MDTQLPPPIALYQLATAHYASQAVGVAAELGIADLLADGPQTAEALAGATDTHAPSLRRVLRLLVNAGVFTEDDGGRFACTPVGSFLSTGPGSFRAIVRLFAGPTTWQAWGDLLTTVRTGEPAIPRLLGTNSFAWFAEHPEEGAIFDEAMGSFTAIVSGALAAGYDFSEMRSLIDVGGGEGALLAGVLRAHPHLRGAVLDLPRLRDGACRQIAAAGLAERYEFVGGDFFEAVPDGFDAYVLKHVIHGWDDDRAVRILERCRRAMSPTAKLLIVEGVYPPHVDHSPESRAAVANDVNMLVCTGGRQRSEAEFRRLYEQAGFRLTRIVPLAVAFVIEGMPA
jgi:SAM-dependent methyltransferase